MSCFIVCPELIGPFPAARNDFLSYDFTTRTVEGYPAERLGPVKRQEAGGGPIAPVLTPAVDFNWLPGVVNETNFDVERDYRRYRGITDGDDGLPAGIYLMNLSHPMWLL